MRKAIVISGVIVVLAVAAFLGYKYFPVKSEKPVIQTFETKQNPAYKAVPQKCPLLVEIKNTEAFFKELSGNNQIIREIIEIPAIDNLVSEITSFSDFVNSHSGIKNLLAGKSVIVSLNLTGKSELTNLYLMQMNDANESNSAASVISASLGAEYTITRRNYDNTVIFNARSAGTSFYFACTNDVLMASSDFIMVEQAIRQTNSINLLNNYEFTETYKTIGENAFANILINHQTIRQLLALVIAPELRKTIGYLDSWSNWTGLDLQLNSSGLQLYGNSITKDSTDNYLNLFRNQSAAKVTIEKAIPANASYFVALNLENTDDYIEQHEAYLKSAGLYYTREMGIKGFANKTKTNPVSLMKEIAGTQFAGVYTTINKSDYLQNRFFVAEIKNESDTREKIEKVVQDFGSTGKAKDSQPMVEYSVDAKNSFDIYKLPVGNMAESLFGKAFAGINGNYLTIYRKYLIWGDNLPGLKNYLQNLVAEKTLANDSVYKVFSKNNQTNANFYVYGKIPKIFRLKDALLKREISSSLSASEEVIRKFSTFSWQYSASGKMVEHRINLKYDPNYKEEPEAIWQLKLDAPLAQKPKIVLNHKDPANREVIVTDKENNVYLVDKEGVVLWKVKLPEPIISEIHQIDLYRNNRFQYLFNTKSQLYVIDRTGSKVGKFPVVFKSMAANGVSIAEYGKNKEYRFFVAGEDKKVYIYDRDGKLVPKWNFEGTESAVSLPIRHFDVDGKDYLVVSDKRNTYFLDRQGKLREGQPAPFERSANPLYFSGNGDQKLISTDQSGRIHIQDFAGNEELKEVGKFGAAHHFAAEDIDGNGTIEYLFSEGKKLLVFAADSKKLFERSFPDAVSEVPFVCSVGASNNTIGVVTGAQNKLYLLNKNGEILRGFPLDGNTSFVLGKFNDATSYFNLIAGSEGGILVNYKVE